MNPFYADLLNRSLIETDSIIIGTLILPNLDPNSIPYIDSDNTVEDIVLNDGELIIGSTANAPTKSTLTGTANQVDVTNGPGSINLSLPQDIATTSSPSFDNLTVNNINGKVANDLVTGPVSAVNDRLAAFNGTSGKVVKDSGVLGSNIFLRDGSVTATGNFDINNQELQNVKAIRPYDTNVLVGNSTSLTFGSSGAIMIGDFTTTTGGNSVNIGLQNIARLNSVAIGKETIAGTGSTIVGYRSSNGVNNDTIIIGRDNTSSFGNSGDIIGVNRSNTTPNSLLLGNGSYTNIRANNTCDLGTSVVPFQSVYSNASLIGSINSRLVNDIVSNTSTGVLNNVVSFVSDKQVKDSGIASSQITTNATNISTNTSNIATNTSNIATNTSNIATNTSNIATNTAIIATHTTDITALQAKTQNQSATAGNTNFTGTLQKGGVNVATVTDVALKVSKSGDTMSGALAMATNNITNVGSLSGGTNTRTADNILSCATNPAYGRLPMFSTNNKVLEDSTVSAFDVVNGPPASVVTNNIAVFSSTTGRAITNAVSGIGTIGALTLSNATAATSSTTGTLILSGSGAGLGVNGKGYFNSNVITGPTQTIALEQTLTMRGGTNSATSPNIIAYTAANQYPVFHQCNSAHDNISMFFDCYFDWNTATLRSASSNGYFSLVKGTNQLGFNYGNAGVAGAAATLTTAGYIDISGVLNWAKPLLTTDTTDATSTTAGSLKTAGGLAVVKQGRFGGKVTITSAGATGLDLASTDTYANLRVIQNTGGIDNSIYIGFGSGVLSRCFVYSNNNLAMRIEDGSNLGLGGGSYGGGSLCFYIANATTVPTSNPSGGGILYCQGGALKYRGSSGTITTIANA